MKVIDELNIELDEKDVQRAYRLGTKKKPKFKPRAIIARFIS